MQEAQTGLQGEAGVVLSDRAADQSSSSYSRVNQQPDILLRVKTMYVCSVGEASALLFSSMTKGIRAEIKYNVI